MFLTDIYSPSGIVFSQLPFNPVMHLRSTTLASAIALSKRAINRIEI